MINYNTIEFVAKTQFGLEEVLAQELKDLGASKVIAINRAVKFSGNQEILYKANLWLRTAITILVPIKSFNIKDPDDLYRQVKSIDWSKYFDVDHTFSIQSTVKSTLFNHTLFPALKSKDAIVDQFREKFGRRPSVELDNPDIRINIHIIENKCSISLDSSGKTLNKRGYRQESVLAPINEVLAAGILKLINWQTNQPLVDPMCGSGTFSIEGGLMADNIAPGLINSTFAFQNWKDFDTQLWLNLLKEAKKAQKLSRPDILANDWDEEVVDIARKNVDKANLGDEIHVTNIDFFSMEIKPNSVIILNPPYDVRLQQDDINQFYENIGNALKKNCSGSVAWIISSNEEAVKHIGLRPSRKIALFNGKLPTKLLKFELYQGSKKTKHK